jgi:GNAT superfamily N-acetyltransferase
VSGAGVAIRQADAQDTKPVAYLLADSLQYMTIAHWLVPDPVERRRVYHAYFDLMVPWFIEHGVVHYTNDGSGAAMWARLPGKFDPVIEDYDIRLAAACGEATPRFVALDHEMHLHHPDTEHWYLAFVGVAPDRQRQGIGAALLEHQLHRLGREAMPAYLEATAVDSARLYARHGFTDRPVYQIGPAGPPLYPMWREPTPR